MGRQKSWIHLPRATGLMEGLDQFQSQSHHACEELLVIKTGEGGQAHPQQVGSRVPGAIQTTIFQGPNAEYQTNSGLVWI